MRYKHKSRVRYSEVDQKGNLTIVALINYLQDCAAFHSDSAGFGLDYLSARSRGWFITNWQLAIPTLPHYGEDIVISTWAYEMRGMFAKRNFMIENASGEALVLANSLWVFMDLATNRPARIPDEEVFAYQVEAPLDMDWGGRKIRRLAEDTFQPQGDTHVMPVHLDTNHHMNNAYYIEIARDALAKGKKIFGIRAEYKKPAELGDRICIRRAESEDIPDIPSDRPCPFAQCRAKSQVLLESEAGESFAVVEFLTD